MNIALLSFCNPYALGKRMLHSVLKKAGHNVKSIFFFFDMAKIFPPEDTIKQLIKLIKDLEPNMIGFSDNSLFLTAAQHITKEIKNKWIFL